MLIASPNVTAAVAAAEAAAAAAAASATSAAASATLASTYASDADPDETYATKASVQVATIPAATLALRTAGYTTAGDYGGALYVRVTSEPSHAGKIRSTDRFLPNGTTSNDNGGWWEIKETIVTPQMFGAVMDGTTDDYQAIMDAVNHVSLGTGVDYAGGDVYFPLGNYKVNSTIQLKRAVRFDGQVAGTATTGNMVGPKLTFAANTTGIIVHLHSTIDAGVEDPATTSAAATIIQGLNLVGSGTDATKHGIWLRGRGIVRNVVVASFPGNGINIAAGGDGNPALGNANSSYVENCRIAFAGRHGVNVEGTDSNACTGIGIDASYCGRYGIRDYSFLGCTWIGCHTEANGTGDAGNNGGTKSSWVYNSGFGYFAVPTATEAQLVATTPGTDSSVWTLSGARAAASSAVPQWLASQAEGTYFHGGAYACLGDNEASVFLGNYAEEGQGASAMRGGAINFGGQASGPGYSAGHSIIGANGNRLITRGTGGRFQANGTTTSAYIGDDKVLTFSDTHDNDLWSLSYDANNFNDWWLLNNNSGQPAIALTNSGTLNQMGTGAAVPNICQIPILALGWDTSTRRLSYGSAAPASGARGRGDIVFNIAPSAGGPVGWVCTVAGTPGTWATFGRSTLEATATVDPASLAAGASTTTATVTVTGAVLGDIVKASFSLDLAGAVIHAWVSAADTVSYFFTNHNGANPLDLGSGTLKVRVEK